MGTASESGVSVTQALVIGGDGLDGGGGDLGGGAGGDASPAGAAGGTQSDSYGEAPFVVGGGGSDEGGGEESYVVQQDPDDPWIIEGGGGGFSVDSFLQWLEFDETPWVKAGKLTRREVVAGVLTLQLKHHLSQGVAESILRFIDYLVGDAADARLPASWREIERLLEGLIITAEKW